MERNSEWLRTFEDSLWLIVITAFTVGYGDIYPRTFLGRAISIAAGVLGVIFAALGTAALSNKLSWTTAEFNVSKLLMKSVIEKKLAYRAVVYLQRTFRRITNRGSNHYCLSRETALRKDRQEWVEAKQEYNSFKQNQDNMELLLKGILDDSGKIGKVTQFLHDHEATKDWISSVTKGSNHPLQLVTSVNILEEQLKNLNSVTAAALEKRTNPSTSIASAKEKQPKPIQRLVDPNDSSVESLIQELHGLCDILDENNKDLDWFANEINTRIRGKAGDVGPDWQSSSSLPFSRQDHPIQEQVPTSNMQSLDYSKGSHSQIPPMNSSLGQGQHPNVPDYVSAIQQQAAAQMQMQTALITKLFEALESPKAYRSRSHGRDRSRSRNGRKDRSRSASAHSHRSRFHHADAAAYNEADEDDQDQVAHSSTHSSNINKSTRVPQPRVFPEDGEVWVDEDETSAISSLPNSLPNSRPVSASMHALANASEQITPRMESRSSRPRAQRF